MKYFIVIIQKTNIMSLISQEKFKELAQIKSEVCVSIFIPTERAGKEVLQQKNSIHLKSRWKEVKSDLEKRDVNPDKIARLGEPVLKLIDDKEFWRHQSDGLAIFITEDFFENYTVPVNFEAHHYISEEFYIKPLIPLFAEDARFYLLAVQLDKVNLYEATRYSIGEVYVEDLTPSRLEEVVGYDYKERNLQFRTQQVGQERAQFHGHGSNERDRKEEILQFFRAIDKGLHSILNEEKVPLVLACQDYLYPIYKHANTYKYLFDKYISGNPSDTDMLGLHQKALEELREYLNQEQRSKLEKFREFNQTDKTTSAVSEIIPAVYEGKVDSLFLENKEEVWGSYDPGNMSVEVQDEQTQSNTSLMNLAAAKVIEQGGNVFLIESAMMPEKSSKMNALLRYNY